MIIKQYFYSRSIKQRNNYSGHSLSTMVFIILVMAFIAIISYILGTNDYNKYNIERCTGLTRYL